MVLHPVRSPRRQYIQRQRKIQAEERLFDLVERELDAKFEKNPKLFLSDNAFTYIQPDFYSHKERIIGEIFSH